MWWAVLAVAMLSFPIYILVLGYGTPSEYQALEVIMLAVACVISMHMGVSIHTMFEKMRKDRQHSKGNVRTEQVEQDEHQTEVEKYIKRINALNENFYTDADGTLKKVAYSRSCDYTASYSDC